MSTTKWYIISITVLMFAVGGCSTKPDKASIETDEKAYETIDSHIEANPHLSANFYIEDPNRQTAAEEILEKISTTGVLNVHDAVFLAVTNSYEYKQERDKVYLVTLNQMDEKHLFELSPFAGAYTQYELDNNDESLTTAGTAGMKQLLSTGTRIVTGVSSGYIDALSGKPQSGLDSIISIAAFQPLLRGSDRVVVLENLTQAQRNTLYQIRNFNRFGQEFITSVVSDYYYILIEYRNINTTKDNYLKLKEIVDKLQKRLNAGRVSKFKFQQAQNEMLLAKDIYQQTEHRYNDLKGLFKVKLSIPESIDFATDETYMTVLENALAESIDYSGEEAIDIALSARLDLVNAFDMVADAERKTVVYADALKGELNLASRNSIDFGADSGDFERTENHIRLALTYDLPLDREYEKHNYKRALISLLQKKRSHLQATKQIDYEVQAALRELNEYRQTYNIQMQAKQTASERLQNTMRLIQYDRADTNDILDAQDDYFDAAIRFNNAIADYSAARLRFFRDTGMLWVEPDGNWGTDRK